MQGGDEGGGSPEDARINAMMKGEVGGLISREMERRSVGVDDFVVAFACIAGDDKHAVVMQTMLGEVEGPLCQLKASEGMPRHEWVPLEEFDRFEWFRQPKNVLGMLQRMSVLQVSVDTPDLDSRTALHLAASNGVPESVHLLLQAGANPQALDRHHNTPLHHVCREAFRCTYVEPYGEVINALVMAGCDVNAVNDEFFTPLHLAVMCSSPPIVSVLLHLGAQPDVVTRPRLNTPLHLVASRFDNLDLEVARILLRSMANARAVNSDGEQPLHIATRKSGEPMMTLLLDGWADVRAADGKGQTPLHIAAEMGAESRAKLLLERGSSAECRDALGNTPLHSAAKCGMCCDRGAVTEVILQLGAPDCNRWNKMEETPLDIALKRKNDSVIQVLMRVGAIAYSVRDVPRPKQLQSGPLHMAAHEGDWQKIWTLLHQEGGHDIEGLDEDGHTPLIIATFRAHEGVVQTLLESRANPMVLDEDGRPPLLAAARMKQTAIVHLLLQGGADVNSVDQQGWTALHHAADNGHEEMVNLLLASGANVSAATNEDGLTPLAAASFSAKDHHSQIDWEDHDPNKPRVTGRYEAVVRALLAKGAQDKTVLHMVAIGGHAGVARLLLERDMDVNRTNEDKLTPLDVALIHRKMGVVRELMRAGGRARPYNVLVCMLMAPGFLFEESGVSARPHGPFSSGSDSDD